MDQIFTYIGQQIDTTLFGFIGGVIASVVTYMSGIALAAVSVWVLHMAFQFIMGKSTEPVLEFMWKAATLYLILGTSTLAGMYHYVVVDTHDALATGVVALFSPPGTVLTNINSVWNALDVFNNAASALVVKVLMNGILKSFTPGLAMFCAVLFSIADVIFLVAALCVTFFAKTISSFLLAVGPIFILTLMFQSTRQYFFNWLGAMLGSVVLTWVVFFVLGFTMNLNMKMANAISSNLGSLNVLVQALVFLALCIAFALFLWQSPSFASGLTGGSPMHMGAQMMLTVISLMRSGGATPPNNSGATGNGGSLTPNRAYNAGQALGQTLRAPWAYQRAASNGGRN
jgi:type IV secretion system protein VirB6